MFAVCYLQYSLLQFTNGLILVYFNLIDDPVFVVQTVLFIVYTFKSNFLIVLLCLVVVVDWESVAFLCYVIATGLLGIVVIDAVFGSEVVCVVSEIIYLIGSVVLRGAVRMAAYALVPVSAAARACADGGVLRGVVGAVCDLPEAASDDVRVRHHAYRTERGLRVSCACRERFNREAAHVLVPEHCGVLPAVALFKRWRAEPDGGVHRERARDGVCRSAGVRGERRRGGG